MKLFPTFLWVMAAILFFSCSDSEPTGAECGNGFVEEGEVCDGTHLDDHTCSTQGFDGGQLACAEDCRAFYTAGCVNTAVCGDGLLEGEEVCDGTNLGGQTCESMGFSEGTLECAGDCRAFDIAGCGLTYNTTIYALQDPTDPEAPAVGSFVRIEGVVVTAVVDGPVEHFFVQTDLGSPAFDVTRGSRFSGLQIYRAPGVTESVVPGDLVNLEGTYEEYYENTMVNLTLIEVVGTAALPVATVVTSAEIATGGSGAEAYEGVLVQVEQVSVTNLTPTGYEYGAFEVTGALRIEDLCYPAVLDLAQMGQAFSFIRGVLNFSYGNTSLNPRDSSDLGID